MSTKISQKQIIMRHMTLLPYHLTTMRKSLKKNVKTGKACGPDSISSKYLKQISPETCGLFEVDKNSIDTKKFPTHWQTGKVSCKFKKGATTDCNNYQPITLLSIPSKVLGVICEKIDSRLEKCNLISEHQGRFRTRRSTESLLINMTERWSKAIDDGKAVVAQFIDLKKAFDCVSYSVLNKKLLASGISGDLHNFTMCYLEDRKQFTVINSESLNTENAKYGVPQGSLYGPRLFTIFSNDLYWLQNCRWN